MKRVLITGANGLLGQALIHTLKDNFLVLATGVEEHPVIEPQQWEYLPLDITRLSRCRSIVRDFRPDVIVNAASYTNVDACEKEKELCWQINVKGPENLALTARNDDIHLIHYSTDYIFDGKEGPYGEDDRPNPLGYYGKSKLASENAVIKVGLPHTILRTCVLYGTGKQVKKNFFLWVLENLRNNREMTIVTDQYNNPTLVEDLAVGTRQVIMRSAEGVYHMAGRDYLNRYEFARAVAEVFDLPSHLIKPIATAELGQAAPRPLRGGLKIERAREELEYHPRSVNESLIYLKWKMEKYA